MESNSKATMFSDGSEMFARVDIKQEHCCSETIKSETEDCLQSPTLVRKNNFSSEPFMDGKSNDIKLNDFQEIEIKEEPLCLESTAINGKFQVELSPVSSKIGIRGKVPFFNEAGADTPSTKSRISTEPVFASTIALKTEDCIEITKEDFHCVIDITKETGNIESTYNELPHKCQICGRSYRIPSLLKTHLGVSHRGSKNKKFKCEICDRKFNWLSTMNNHMSVHEGTKPHKCQLCGKSFILLHQLKKHVLAHEGKKSHKCNICGKSFTEPSNLRKHSHEGKKPFRCKICQKSFPHLENLKLHTLVHEGNRPHKCDTCQETFTHRSLLSMHTLIHGGLKPHKCEHCEKRFINMSHLRKHRAIHEPKKTYKCEICGKQCSGIGYLKNHMVVHERKRPQK